MEPTPQIPIQLPEIDTNPEHNSEDERLSEEEKAQTDIFSAFFGLRKEWEDYLVEHPKDYGTKELIRTHDEFWRLVSTNTEGQIILWENSSISPYNEIRNIFLVERGLHLWEYFARAFTNNTYEAHFKFTTFSKDGTMYYRKKVREESKYPNNPNLE